MEHSELPGIDNITKKAASKEDWKVTCDFTGTKTAELLLGLGEKRREGSPGMGMGTRLLLGVLSCGALQRCSELGVGG